MLTLKESSHIRTSRNIKSFCSCRHATGVSLVHRDQGRIALGEEKLARKEIERLWRAEQWCKHPVRSR